MTALVLLLTCGVFPPLSSPKSQDESSHLTADEALKLIRAINTAEADLFSKSRSYAPLEDLLKHPFLQRRPAAISQFDSSAGTLKNYKLTVVVSGGQHYEASLLPLTDCDAAFFTNESGIIYSGRSIGCSTGQ
jgi:hypothetical protein